MANETKCEGSFTNDRGFKIFCKYWSQYLINPRALLFITHGLSEHCLYYEEIAEEITKKGFYVFSHDHQGHGQSEGTRILIKDTRHWSNDVLKHIDLIREQFPNLPVFILGHSLGGVLSIQAALDRPDFFKGVALLGPLVIPDSDAVSPVRVFIGKLCARLVPQLPVLWIKNTNISHDSSVCQKYEDDPLNYHGGLKAGTGLSILNATIEIESKLETIKWPFLIIHGAQDKIVPPRGSKTLYEKASSQDKTLHTTLYPQGVVWPAPCSAVLNTELENFGSDRKGKQVIEECFHQPHHETEPIKSQTLTTLVDWLEKRID